MIVVDSNVIAYCWLAGPQTVLAQRVRAADPDWHVPVLWRSELRSVLTGYLRDGSLAQAQVLRVMGTLETALAPTEHLVQSESVFTVARQSNLSAYDCEFVALALALAAPLVTADAAILKAYPQKALSMSAFLAAQT